MVSFQAVKGIKSSHIVDGVVLFIDARMGVIQSPQQSHRRTHGLAETYMRCCLPFENNYYGKFAGNKWLETGELIKLLIE